MPINTKANKIKKLLRKTGFSLVEVVAAVAISGITIVSIVKVSLTASAQAVQNDNADRATQIASNTINSLLQFKSISGHTFFCLKDSANNPSDNGVYYLGQDPFTNIITLSKTAPNIKTQAIIVPYLQNRTGQEYTISGIEFGQDNLLTPNDVDNRFYRAIYMEYDKNSLIVKTNVIIYWSLNDKDNFYSSDYSFNVADVCQPSFTSTPTPPSPTPPSPTFPRITILPPGYSIPPTAIPQ